MCSVLGLIFRDTSSSEIGLPGVVLCGVTELQKAPCSQSMIEPVLPTGISGCMTHLVHLLLPVPGELSSATYVMCR